MVSYHIISYISYDTQVSSLKLFSFLKEKVQTVVS